MELTDNALIDLLLRTQQPEPRRLSPRRKITESTPTYHAPASKNGTRRCTCRVCPSCVDNARWERIFQEKFADPNYYAKPLRRDSSLKW
jgi:hypothetical protein